MKKTKRRKAQAKEAAQVKETEQKIH